MDAGTWIGIGIAVTVGGALVRALTLPPRRDPEPEYDPASPYSPAGTKLLAELRERHPAETLDTARSEWH